MAINSTNKKLLNHLLIMLLSIIMLFAIIFIPIVIRHNKEFDILSNDGEIAYCIVIDSYKMLSKTSPTHMIVCKYFVDGLIYFTKARGMKKYIYSIGDTLAIIYSKQDPTIHRIIDVHVSYDVDLWENVIQRLIKNDRTNNAGMMKNQ